MRPQIIPVIHYQNDVQCLRNAEIAFETGCESVFLIQMEGKNDLLPLVAKAIKAQHPDKLVGINYLGLEPAYAVAANIGHGLDMTWTDVQLTHSAGMPWKQAVQVQEELQRHPDHLLFSGVAFKHQAEEPDPEFAALTALHAGFIPTTSGEATGVATETDKIVKLRRSLGPTASLAIASGITPDNAHEYAPYLSHILVATGVSATFYDFDIDKLRALRTACGYS